MKKSPVENPHTYWAIIGVSALLCFAWMMTGSFFMTLAILLLGMLHLAREFPEAEEFITADPVLVWLRTMSPLIVIGIFALSVAVRYLWLN